MKDFFGNKKYHCLIQSDDKRRKLQVLKNAAFNGDIKAMFFAGMLLINDKEQVDKQEASRFFKMAADLRDAKSMFQYGSMLDTGDGIPVNKKGASRYYKMSADLGEPVAMIYYALMLQKGEDIPEDQNEADRYFQMFDQNNHKLKDPNY